MPVKTGTRQLGIQPGAKIDAKTKKPPRTMRCVGCGGQALETPNGKGGSLLRCPNCKREFTFTRM